ncbi:MAG: PEP-CTERM sorting domain-containing protein [Luteolibacter sp.]
MKAVAALAAGLLAVACLPVCAQSLTWNLTGSAGVLDAGDKLIFTKSNVTVTASAWAYTYGSSDNALEAASLGQWNVGMGVVSGTEDPSGIDHQLDNEGPDEWVLFMFSSNVQITGVTIDPYGVYDRDVTYWVGSVSPNLNLTGKTYADLASLGFSAETADFSTASESARTVSISGSGTMNAILFGAKRGEFSGSDIDRFKITAISGTPIVAVPEPSGLLLGALGLVTLFKRRR